MAIKRSTSWLIVMVMAVLAIWSAVVIYREYFSGESEVYLAYLDSLKGNDRWPDVAFLSSPGTCQIDDVNRFPEISAELKRAFFSANTDAVPNNLYALMGAYNTVAYEDAIQTHRSGSLQFRPTDKRIVKLSRVGFDASKQQALFCIAAPDVAFLTHMSWQNDRWVEMKSIEIWTR